MKWTKEEDILLLKLMNQNISMKEMLKHFPERTIDSISSRKRLLNIKKNNNRVWDEEKINFLQNNYKEYTVKEFSEKLGLSFSTVIKKMKELDIYIPNNHWKAWTEEENEYLKSVYQFDNYYTIGRKLKRSASSVQQQANKLGLKKGVPGRWTDEEIQYLKDNYTNKSIKNIQKKIKRTTSAIYNKAYELNLDNLNKDNKEKEIAFILSNCDIKTDEEIANCLNCSIDKVVNIRKNNGIYKVASSGKETTIEKKVEQILKEIEIDYNKQFIISDFKVDFFIPEFNLILEVQGDYWHCNPRIYSYGPIDLKQSTFVLKDYNKKSHLLSMGYDIFYVWEQDIKTNYELLKKQLKYLLKTVLPSQQEIVGEYYRGIKRENPPLE